MKKILLILAAVMLIMSVCVVASAAVPTVTYDGATHPGVAVYGNVGLENTIFYLTTGGLTDGATGAFPTDVAEGDYIVTAKVATNMDGNKIQAYLETPDDMRFDMPFAAGKIDVPNVGWGNFSDITLGIAKIKGDRTRVALNVSTSKPGSTWVRIQSISLRPVDEIEEKAITIMGTPAQREGVGGNTNNLMELGDINGIPIVDHIIFTDDDYYSFYENSRFKDCV